MRPSHLNWKKQSAGKSMLGLFLLGLFCSVLLFASSSSLHNALHPNATSPDHQCAAKLLSSGQVHAAASTSGAVVIVRPVLFEISIPESFLPVRHSFCLPPGRAPPASPG
jgi:hypothetical protein